MIAQDVDLRLDKLLTEEANLKTQKEELITLDNKIRKTKKGSIYIELRNIAGSVVLVGIVIASYKAKIPPGLRAMLTSYLLLDGLSHGMIKLNEIDIKKLTDGMTKVRNQILNYQMQLQVQKNYYCKLEPRHVACY